MSNNPYPICLPNRAELIRRYSDMAYNTKIDYLADLGIYKRSKIFEMLMPDQEATIKKEVDTILENLALDRLKRMHDARLTKQMRRNWRVAFPPLHLDETPAAPEPEPLSYFMVPQQYIKCSTVEHLRSKHAHRAIKTTCRLPDKPFRYIQLRSPDLPSGCGP